MAALEAAIRASGSAIRDTVTGLRYTHGYGSGREGVVWACTKHARPVLPVSPWLPGQRSVVFDPPPMSLSFRSRSRLFTVAGALLALGCSPMSDQLVAPEISLDGPSNSLAMATGPVLMFTEVMADPSKVADEKGEWIEIYNAGDVAADLKDYVLGSGPTVNSTAQNATVTASLVVAPKQCVVLGINGDFATNGGVRVDFQYASVFNLNNSNTDWITLKTGAGALVDSIAYSASTVVGTSRTIGSPTYTPLAGASRVMKDAAVDNTILGGTNWEHTPTGTTYGAGDRGTPGACAYAPAEPPGPLATVAVTGPTSVTVGKSITLTVETKDANGRLLTGGTVAWSVAGSAAVSVQPSGRTATVTGDGIGDATITAQVTIDDVTRTASTEVTVTAAPIPGGSARISFSGFNTAPLPVGFEDQIFATVRDAAGTVIPNMAVTWRALTPELATIDATTGIIRPVAAGKAFFVARTADGFEASAYVFTAGPAEAATTANYGNHLEFGRPTDATPADDHLVEWPQFVASWNRTRGQSNWIAYNLEASHRGPAERCDCFTPDPKLPGDFPVVTTADYVGSGYSRGHMTMSEDRTAGGSATTTSLDNARTFYLTNIVPQTSQNNGGAWLGLENALGDSATRSNREVYIIAGGAKYEGTLNNAGKIAIPTMTWKVAVIMPRDRGLGDVRGLDDLKVIAVAMPNTTTIPQVQSDWPKYMVTVDSLERLTGYDLLAALPSPIEELVESGTYARPPVAAMSGPATGVEGQPLTFTSTSTDPDPNDVLSYAWVVGGDTLSRATSLTGGFPDDGSATVTLVVRDKYGWADTTSKTVVITNAAPVVGSFAGATLVESGTYGATGAFTDPGADSWTATVDYGDGSGVQTLALGADKRFALSHRYVDDGLYTVTVTVTETDAGVSDTRTATVKVENAAPVVAAFLGATILRGEHYAATGSFTDLGTADRWTATVDYGDGSGAQALDLTAGTFTLAHTYPVAGSYVVRVTVRDTDGGVGTRTVAVVVETPLQGVTNLVETIDALGPRGAGPLDQGEATSLRTKLSVASAALRRGDTRPAVEMLEAFVHEIDALERSGRLASGTAEPLRVHTRRVIRSIG